MNIRQAMDSLEWRCQGKYRLRQYVREYLTACATYAEPVQLLTIWCMSRSLEKRLEELGKLVPFHKERKVMRDFKWCHDLFAQAGMSVNQFILLVGSGVERGLVSPEVQKQYQGMIERLACEERLDVIAEIRPAACPDETVLSRAEELRLDPAVIREVDRRLHLAQRYGDALTESQAFDEAVKSIAVKCAEAKQLVADFSDFVLIPVEFVERYRFHNLGWPGFTDRLLPITQPYPWRLPE
jgi:hypothetical protein